MKDRYASEELIYLLMNRDEVLVTKHDTGGVFHKTKAKARNIIQRDCAIEKFPEIIEISNWIVGCISQYFSINANIYYAIAESSNPFSACYVGGDNFVVLIDFKSLYKLKKICFCMQRLKPLAELIGSVEVPQVDFFLGKCLLEIVREFLAFPIDLGRLSILGQNKTVFYAALTYIIGHEIAHISHGHLEFKLSPEFKKYSFLKGGENLTMCALEMDADSSAVSSVFVLFEKTMDSVFEEINSEKFLNIEEFKLHRRRCYIIGIYMAHIYQDALSDSVFPEAYPIGYARFLISAKLMEIFYLKNNISDVFLPESMRKYLIEAFVNLSGDLRFLGHPMASNLRIFEDGNESYVYNDFGEAAGYAHLEPINGRWSSIRNDLEKYRRGGIIAPAIDPPI